MPQPRHTSEAFDGYVTLSQLVSSPQVLADYDMIDHHNQLDTEFKPGFFSPFASINEKPQQVSFSNVTSWDTHSFPEMPMTMSPYHSSSPSSSPSPKEGYISVTAEQHSKRRAQNRAAQRAYRDRKVRHLVDLESGIRDIEAQIRRLQTENTELIRELCEIRAENQKWQQDRARQNANQRTTTSNSNSKSSTSAKASKSPPQRLPPSSKVPSLPKGHEAEEVDNLYGPFAAMWNLIRLDPSVVKGSVTAETVLERLRSMVEEVPIMERRKSSLTSIAENDEGANGSG